MDILSNIPDIVEGSKFKVLPIALGVFKLLLIKQFKTPYSAGVIL
ncbi:hypothetical protein SA8601_0026 [Staphylococcus aureus subsp. aureus SA8601]|nr:hypothetical protein CA347_2795 [Staphylococcus aureus CA-347]AWE54963.1 hypothetical protein CSC51_2678 [Staphylococcus aureus]EHT17145.1 hypothetical protein SACIG1165_2730 [Staphylococcus aureus subsp. aureus CIG1165]EHT45486.1 hypothetical protein SACIG1096_2810 [Staphylococcus aureus subsp. aureus CIG1096]EHT54333.1 hypothetical protein SACIG1150_2699 [Staphylococcus aureus subsp. aureus CIG1150]EHT75819.1 hypothetical protein SACIG1524_2300 [Staphylococcus aureus subsp. aureus CIG1524